MAHAQTSRDIERRYELAREQYAELGVDADGALEALGAVALSLHCWQGDDVGGFEAAGAQLGGGLAVTGSYPGKARSAGELRRDLDRVYSLLPGRHRLNLHAIYAETGGRRVERDALEPAHYAGWVDWARAGGHGLDFNPTCFAHPLAEGGYTLASADPGVRQFWVDHCRASRRIGAHFGRELGTPCVTNIWIPDGSKDAPADRRWRRELLQAALDQVLAEPLERAHNRDCVESKLFGLGSESFVVGSHEFYMGYALSRQILLCLDSGHFHPTESIADKISALLLYLDELLLHVSRGVRWDSDHVVLLNDELQAIMQEVVRGGFLERVHIGLDFFDASINRVAAWVIGARSALRALLLALLEPSSQLRALEREGDYTARLALQEHSKGLPAGAVWDYCCLQAGVPPGMQVMDEIRAYEREELAGRG
jgi:L-rhamnose isomerase